MTFDWAPIRDALGTVLLLAAAAGVFAVVFQRRRRNDDAARQDELLRLAKEEASAHKARADRLEGELAEQRERHTLEIHGAREEIRELRGVVQQAQSELEAIRRHVLVDREVLAVLITDAVLAGIKGARVKWEG